MILMHQRTAPTRSRVERAATIVGATITLAVRTLEVVRTIRVTKTEVTIIGTASRYPKPESVIYDQGGEFVGPEFQGCLITNGIETKPITIRNPQANAINEQSHKTIEDML